MRRLIFTAIVLVSAAPLSVISGPLSAQQRAAAPTTANRQPTTATRVTLAQYIAALERIDGLLAARQLDAAKSEASLLKDAQVVWPKGTFVADASLLAAIANAQLADGAHRARLILTIDELRLASGMEVAYGNRRLLERIAAEQEPPELPRGGDIDTTIDRDVPLLERVATSIVDMLRWVWKKIVAFIDWLIDLLPRSERGQPGGDPALRWIVFAVVAAIVLLVTILAVRVLLRSRAAEPAVETSAPLGSTRDEDPLSRGASEWERYAGELAAAGQFREAIRAWYHAVLVTCYAAGILHFRKGRTNWEYVASLAPLLTWRPDLIELTRRFEREWYGADQSTPDALEECSERARRILETLRREMRGAA